MEKQEKDLEDEILDVKEKKGSRHQEAGRGENGEPSSDALRRWFIWAGAALLICLAVVLAGAVMSSGKNKKETAVLQLDAGPAVELGLNRKGAVLRADGQNPAGAALLSGLDFEHAGLEKGMELLIGALTDSDDLSDTKAMLLTVQKSEDEDRINVSRLTEQAVLYMENALKKRQAGALIYAGTAGTEPELMELEEQYGISVGKAAFVKNLVDKNIKLRLEDTGRLARMEIQGIAEEIDRNKYATSFECMVVEASYEEKEAERETAKGSTEESAEESTNESQESAEESTEAPESSEEKEDDTGKTDAAKPGAEKKAETAAMTAAPAETAAPESAPAETASPESVSAETAAPESSAETPAAPETPAPETAPEAPAQTDAPVPEETSAVNPKGPGFAPDGSEPAPEVKSPLAGPGA